MTGLFNIEFQIYRSSAGHTQGMPDENFTNTGMTVLGRFSAPTYKEREIYQNRELPLTTKIYCDPYLFDVQNDVLYHNGYFYKVQEIIPRRNALSEINHLEIFASERRDDFGSYGS